MLNINTTTQTAPIYSAETTTQYGFEALTLQKVGGQYALVNFHGKTKETATMRNEDVIMSDTIEEAFQNTFISVEDEDFETVGYLVNIDEVKQLLG